MGFRVWLRGGLLVVVVDFSNLKGLKTLKSTPKTSHPKQHNRT
jgi:hypothetical protein